ncbi:Dipeptidyl carboxypeptidase Dcp [Rhodovulum sp. PH10]|uniref:M3 family metallopeptidase n=1 Tax=Rhodovulum sp. PH10 TaxID=1187851 RepID=UPI00027C2B8F|nr:M3 family metallopeptidase [Rhodovulum sp. PH10]EJW11188.1 Dipeptidyl carboxypeptidase Dcp [Rhodovulum sp. PH10]
MTAQPSADLSTSENPFFATWDTPFETPPFGAIAPGHYLPAFERALAEHVAEIEAIATESAAPTFANTVAAMERSGRALNRVSSVFFVLVGANSDDALLAIERAIVPRLAAHANRIRTDARLAKRLAAIDADGLDAEQTRVLERYRLMFRRAGAGLDAAAKEKLATITERLARLGTTFSQNVLADEQSFVMLLDEADLAGLGTAAREEARAAAAERGHPGKYAITLARSSVEGFLRASERRDLREQAFRAWTSRGCKGGPTDNAAVIAETIRLRAERARLLGYETFADYRLDDSMAKTPQNVRALLERVWAPARARALADRDAMQDTIRREGGNFPLAAWDWRHYAEKVRKARYGLDEEAVRPYLPLDQMIAAAFDTATRLFGITFAPRKNVPVWHPDVRVWEVSRDGAPVGLFFGDYFARASKRSGAWMTSLRRQEKLDAAVLPLIVNVTNFAKPAPGEPALLSFDDARTLFHEFGHALHGLLSNVTYPLISGTGVATDFVELPSQLYEHWVQHPDVLRRFARHAVTGAQIPDELIEKILRAKTFDQGFATVEYVASALVDLDFHALSPQQAQAIDPAAFERDALARIGMPEEISMRHRPPHFTHVFSGGGYASAYYSYMWSEVMDADAFAAFEEAGDPFDPATARKLHDAIYSAGGRQDPADAYVAFRGRLPTPDALLKKRGLADEAA